jgi:hypothetical protein
MNDTRIRILNFILLSIAYSISEINYIPIMFLSSILVSVIFRNDFIKNISIILYTSVAILIIGAIAWFFSSDLLLVNIVLNLLRWISLIIISVIFFSSINLFEFVSSLVFLKIPTKIAIAIGVGFRFLPVIIDESKKVAKIQNQNGISLSFNSIRKLGLLTVLNKILSPLLVSILRRTDSISISVTIQQIEKRTKDFNFKTINLFDLVSLLFCILILTLAIVNYDINFFIITPDSQAHLQFARADTLPKIAKELICMPPLFCRR